MSNWLLSTVTPCKNSLWQGSRLQHKPKPYCIVESKTKSKGTFPNPISWLYTPTCSFTWQLIVHIPSDSLTATLSVFGDWTSKQRKFLHSEEPVFKYEWSPSEGALSARVIATAVVCIKSSLWFSPDGGERPSPLAVSWDTSLAEVLLFWAEEQSFEPCYKTTQGSRCKGGLGFCCPCGVFCHHSGLGEAAQGASITQEREYVETWRETVHILNIL